MRSISIDPPTIASYDAVLIVTDHSEIDWQSLVDAAQLVVDTRNATAKVNGGKEKFSWRDDHFGLSGANCLVLSAFHKPAQRHGKRLNQW